MPPPTETPASDWTFGDLLYHCVPAAPTRNLPWPDGCGKVLHLMAQDATSTEIVLLLQTQPSSSVVSRAPSDEPAASRPSRIPLIYGESESRRADSNR